jgi:acyl carrier protein
LQVVLLQFPSIPQEINPEDLELNSFPSWDSLGHFNLLMAIEKKFDIRFTFDEILDLKRLIDIQKSLIKKGIKL